MKRMIAFLPMILSLSCFLCAKTGDIAGTYKRVMGDYRYDTIQIDKADGNRYSITILDNGQKKLQTVSALDKNTLQMGWLAPITVRENRTELVLNVGKGTLFRKVAQ